MCNSSAKSMEFLGIFDRVERQVPQLDPLLKNMPATIRHACLHRKDVPIDKNNAALCATLVSVMQCMQNPPSYKRYGIQTCE